MQAWGEDARACSEHPFGEGGGQLVLIQVEQFCRIGKSLVPAHRHAVVARAVKFDVAQPQNGGQQQPHLLLRAPQHNDSGLA